ncbi:hypothetical protein DW260_01845 [Clostridium sp. AM22-16AC]|nr:hypothetical protein [Clostridium sp. AM22-16AC]RHO05752.1 hypothetical protein DW260_01845 [Clostridium sp. AM22-16AC]
MIHVILMILKIIGILVLLILGLILAAILLILFVPMRYRADISFDGKPDGEAAVSWLLQAVRIRVSYHEHADVSGQVLWFKLFDMRLWPPEDEAEEFESDRNDPKTADEEPGQIISEINEIPEIPDRRPETGTPESSASKPSFSESTTEQKADILDLELEKHAGSKLTVVPESLKEDDELVVHATEISSGSDVQITQSNKGKTSKEKRTGFAAKIREKFAQLIKKLRALFTCIRELQGKTGKLADGILKKKISLEKTWNSISMFWHDEQNQKAFRLIRKRIGKLVRYVLPRKLSGRIHFGFDDPYDTGQVLTAVSPFYGFYAKTLTLEPDFTGTALDGEIHLKGRIALWYPLWTAARLFISKDFRRLLRFLRKRNAKKQSR